VITASRVSIAMERRLRVFGREGEMAVDFLGRSLAVLRRGGAEPMANMPDHGIDRASWTDHDSLEAEQAGFAAACLDGVTPEVDAAAGRRALAAALAVDGRDRRGLGRPGGRLARISASGESPKASASPCQPAGVTSRARPPSRPSDPAELEAAGAECGAQHPGQVRPPLRPVEAGAAEQPAAARHGGDAKPRQQRLPPAPSPPPASGVSSISPRSTSASARATASRPARWS
jgi:hypothetical protein